MTQGCSAWVVIGAIVFFIIASAGPDPWRGGAVYDSTGSYLQAFWIAPILSFPSLCRIAWAAATGDSENSAEGIVDCGGGSPVS